MGYLRWSEVPYAGEKKPPSNPVDPLAGSWPTFFIRQTRNGGFRDLNGQMIQFNLQNPNSIDWELELKTVQKTLKSLTKRQQLIAHYWGDGAATKQWTPIADRLIDTYDMTPPMAARILSILQGGINDTFAVTWYFKYLWDVARPNQYDQKLASFLCTPRFPAYPSGHSSISGCAEVILGYYFPAEASRLRKLAEQNAKSRIYAGVHFPIDVTEGLRLGREIGEMVVLAVSGQVNRVGERIDVQKTRDRRAKLPPPPYRQVIPFDFEDGRNTSVCGCESKVLRRAQRCKRLQSSEE